MYQVRYLLSYLYFVLYSLVNCFVKSCKTIKPKTILLVRLDAIGDYILFRNFIEVLRKSDKYKDYKITFLGNIVWKDLFDRLDKNFVDDFIFLNRNKFKKNLFYRSKKLKEIVSQGYELVLNPRYSREIYYDDWIVKSVNAQEKIGSIGDLSNNFRWQKEMSDKYYTKLISVKPKIMFEFHRNKEFFEQFLNVKLEIEKPSINKLGEKNLRFSLPPKYAILFIGASTNKRKWRIENFAEIARYLKNNYDYEIVLCGDKNDRGNLNKFNQQFCESYFDLVGKTSLSELVNIFKNAEMLISNETFAPHLSIALGVKKIFVISNGNHFGRFTPYPKEISDNYYAIYHSKIEINMGNYEKLANMYGYGSKLKINEISVDKVKNTIDIHVNNQFGASFKDRNFAIGIRSVYILLHTAFVRHREVLFN